MRICRLGAWRKPDVRWSGRSISIPPGTNGATLAQIYLRERRMQDAGRLFDTAWRLADSSGDRAKASVGLAVLAEEERRFDLAERHYEEALRLDPICRALSSGSAICGSIKIVRPRRFRSSRVSPGARMPMRCRSISMGARWRWRDGLRRPGARSRAPLPRIRRWTTHGRCCAAPERHVVGMRAARWALLAAATLGAVFGLHRIADPDLHQQIAVGRAILALLLRSGRPRSRTRFQASGTSRTSGLPRS